MRCGLIKASLIPFKCSAIALRIDATAGAPALTCMLPLQLRSARSLLEPEDAIGEEGGEGGVALVLDGQTVLLDPMANTPLKIHEADISSLAAKDSLDSLPLRLTDAGVPHHRVHAGQSSVWCRLSLGQWGRSTCLLN